MTKRDTNKNAKNNTFNNVLRRTHFNAFIVSLVKYLESREIAIL